MSDEGTRRSRVTWITSLLHPERRVAAPTIAALRALLGGRRNGGTGPVGPDVQPMPPLEVRLEQLPDLEDIGGIARVTGSGGETVGVARVGRNSFVGYRLEEEVLREVEVELDQASGALRIGGKVAGVR